MNNPNAKEFNVFEGDDDDYDDSEIDDNLPVNRYDFNPNKINNSNYLKMIQVSSKIAKELKEYCKKNGVLQRITADKIISEYLKTHK